MKTAAIAAAALLFQLTASADMTYTSTRKTTGGAMAAMAGPSSVVSKISLKGHKMKTEEGDRVTILDAEAQTMTSIDNARKTYTVLSLAEASANTTAANISMDVKETGQRKTINGFDAKEVVFTMETDLAQGRGGATMPGMSGKAQVEGDLWIAPVPGTGDIRAFYAANASRLGGAGVQASLAEIQRKAASMNGVPVEVVVKIKPAGGAAAPQMPQMTPAQQAQMDQARAKLEAMKAQGGPGAAMADQALARMGNMGQARGGASSPYLIEMTIDSTDFSSASIPESAFAIPSGYQEIKPR